MSKFVTGVSEEERSRRTQHRPNPTSEPKPPKRNKFYALKGREEQEKSADVVTGTLHVFCLPIYALLDP